MTLKAMVTVQALNTIKAMENTRKVLKIGGMNMKELRLNLQLFADGDDGSSADNGGTDGANSKDVGGAKDSAKDSNSKDNNSNSQAKYTDDDVNKIIDKKFAEWQKKQQKEVDEAKKLAEMNATQKAEYERDQLKKKLEELEKQASLGEMSKTARKMLADSNINISEDLLAMMVTTDAEETKTAVDSFAKLFNEAVESAVKERVKGEPPKRSSGSGAGSKPMTKEEIMAIKDHELRQKKMLEHKDLFNL